MMLDMTDANSPRVPDPERHPTLDLWPTTGRFFGLCKASTYDAARRGEIPTIRVGRRLLVPTAELRRMLKLDDSGPAA
jgi:hypothetical protein